MVADKCISRYPRDMHKRDIGFTIVELLVVIVVISILATLTIVTDGGIQNRASDSSNDTNARNLTAA